MGKNKGKSAIYSNFYAQMAVELVNKDGKSVFHASFSRIRAIKARVLFWWAAEGLCTVYDGTKQLRVYSTVIYGVSAIERQKVS